MAGSFVGFETVGPNAATEGLVLAQQFRPTMGIRFSRADGGSVTLAKTGAPCTAFAAGPDTATWTTGDSLLTTDPWASSVGDFFVKLSHCGQRLREDAYGGPDPRCHLSGE